MNRIPAFLAAALVSSAAVSLSPSAASACSCAETTLEQALASSTAIFEARVVSIATDGASLEVTLAVTQAWRGVNSETVVLRTPSNEAACGYHFEEGLTYLVYASGESEALSVSLCSRTRLMLEAEADRAALGSGTIPVDITDEPVEPVRAARTEPPARGGCASCWAHQPDRPLTVGPVAFWLLLGAIALRRTKRP